MRSYLLAWVVALEDGLTYDPIYQFQTNRYSPNAGLEMEKYWENYGASALAVKRQRIELQSIEHQVHLVSGITKEARILSRFRLFCV